MRYRGCSLRLPTLGYTFDSFAPAQLIRRISRPAPPSEVPCGSLSLPSPKVSIHPLGCLRQSFSAALRLPTLGYTFDFPFYHGAIARVFLRLTCQALVAQRGGWRRLRIPIPRSARKILTCQDRRVKKRTCDSSHVECRIFSKIRHAHSAIRHQLSIFRFPPPRSPPLRASPFPVSHSRCLSVRFTQPPIKTET